MVKAGRRYPLVIYTRMIDRWWPAIFFLGLALLALAWPFYQDLYTRLTEPWRWMTLAGLGAILIFISFIMLALRKSAYVQPFGDHLLLATPFLRMNISYRRILRTTTASMAAMFPPKSLRGMKREIIEPLASMTAVVIELNAFPISPAALKFFLSPFFFKDRTPHFVILTQNWMGFSTELESLRASGNQPLQHRTANQSILSKLPKK
ncbi:MAG: hypothetical protein HYX49_01580 [Chloroflexi bacterium]|nr:hypothetical protein [Chloroflexota bacterium]